MYSLLTDVLILAPFNYGEVQHSTQNYHPHSLKGAPLQGRVRAADHISSHAIICRKEHPVFFTASLHTGISDQFLI